MAKAVRPKKARPSLVVSNDIRDVALADAGRERLEAAARDLPVLRAVQERFAKQAPLDGVRVAACLPLTVETAHLAVTLKAGGALVSLCASRPADTRDDVAAALVVDHDIPTYGLQGEDTATYLRHVQALLDTRPQLVLEEGADVTGVLHTRRRELLPLVLGSTEETPTGAHRLRALARAGVLGHPVVAVGEARTWRLFDAGLGRARAAMDGVLRATRRSLAGRVFVVVGLGDTGRSVARQARALGAEVVVTEFEPVAALEAAMEGFRVLPLGEATKRGDVLIVTADVPQVLRAEHFEKMKDGAVVVNASAHRAALDVEALARLSRQRVDVDTGVAEHTLEGGRRLIVLAEARPLQQEGAGARGVRDVVCAHHALVAEWLAAHSGTLTKDVHAVPPALEDTLARLALRSLGLKCDTLTEAQALHLAAWREGT
ncbi:adenosylhomocysteinase [Myxococcus sp. K15C18031901]|uniref:adenosylhomocysteinase n=1 Tax=Myxococcus dinghuensis TaxID=2906761 RepID=UPI0020A74640|nr:adenosylhomocysteinase [Myxococcus dinghuensis]MCP3102209.1 adenosylhomocysteinase [Myxococcus dinghuensis]